MTARRKFLKILGGAALVPVVPAVAAEVVMWKSRNGIPTRLENDGATFVESIEGLPHAVRFRSRKTGEVLECSFDDLEWNIPAGEYDYEYVT